ncbi:MAG: helix-turn-helix transcriptional regulator [Pseudomonadota bacterium]
MISESDLSKLVARTYAVALDHDQWLPLLDFATDVFGGVGTSFEVFDQKTGHPLFLELGSGLKHVCAPEYLEYYGQISPRVRHAEKIGSGAVTYDYAVLSETEMEADEFYNDCMAPLGLRYFVAGHLRDGNGHLGALAVQRSPKQGHVDTEAISLMQTLVPHIQQAVDLKYRLMGSAAETSGFIACLEDLEEAAILVNVDGKVVYANRAAHNMVAADDGLEIDDRTIGFRSAACKDQLNRMLAGMVLANGEVKSNANASFIAPRPSGARPYLVSVRRLASGSERFDIEKLRAAAIVFVRDPGTFNCLDTDLLSMSYGLSVAEVQLAVSLDQGRSTKEIALQRGVAPTTVRSQLYALMAKLSVKRQVDLVRLLARYRKPFS